MELTNSRTGEAFKALKYAPPKKFTAVKAIVNGVEQDARYTNSRGKDYTYFNVDGFSLYVPGKLEDGVDHNITLPEGFKGPAWAEDRKSTYVPKRKPKEKADGEQTAATGESAAESGNSEGSDDATAAAEAGAEATSEGQAAPRARRKRGE